MSARTSAGTDAGPVTADGGPRPVAVLVALGAWSIAVPYIAPSLGLDLDVTQTVEFVDHVVPGTLVVACAVTLLSLARRGRSGSLLSMGLACAIALAGMWITATHVPLLVDAGRGVVPWGTACFHTASGPVILALALARVRHELRLPEPDQRAGG